MNAGKIFENNWKQSIPEEEVYYMRIKDSPASFNQTDQNLRFSLNNPYDTYLFWNRSLFPMELKSTQSTSISIQKDKKEKGKMIKIHQIEGLLKASTYDGINAGFLLDFRNKLENTYFLNILDFKKFLDISDKKSINEKDVIQFGGILINKIKKKINYKYDVLGLLKEIQKGAD